MNIKNIRNLVEYYNSPVISFSRENEDIFAKINIFVSVKILTLSESEKSEWDKLNPKANPPKFKGKPHTDKSCSFNIIEYIQ